jgi:nucleoside diphosphate kinase
VLAKIVNLFYKKGLKKIIEAKLVISLKDEFALIKESSRDELFNKELIENVYMDGMLNQLDVNDIFLTPKGLKVGILLSGKLNVRIE